MAEDRTTPQPPTLFDVRNEWDCILALTEAAGALKRATDLMLMAYGSTTAAASVNVLFEAAVGLQREMGQHFVSLRISPDPEVRHFVQLVVDRLRTAPVTEPSKETLT